MCGNEIADTVKFCPVCGNQISAALAVKPAEIPFTGAGEEQRNSIINEPAETKGTNGFAIASLVLGLVAVPFGWILWIPSILAVIFGIIGITKASSIGSGRGLAIAGLIIGIVTALLWIMVTVTGIAFLGAVISIMNF